MWLRGEHSKETIVESVVAELARRGPRRDGQASIIYDAGLGEVSVNARANTE